MHNNDQQPSLKRRRSLTEDSSDFLPLSKRINCLNINNPKSNELNQLRFDDVLVSDYCLVTPPGSVQTNCSDERTNELLNHVYNPSLDATKNPFYYKSNQLLFELYVERSFRRGDYFTENP